VEPGHRLEAAGSLCYFAFRFAAPAVYSYTERGIQQSSPPIPACASVQSDVQETGLTCSVARLITIALLLLSLTLLGQARSESFSCGAAVRYSSAVDSGCEQGCCKDSSCCKTQRTESTAPIHHNGAKRVNLDWVESKLSFRPLVLILPMPAGLEEPVDTVGHTPAVLSINCVRLI
jgi:hypothetical protein